MGYHILNLTLNCIQVILLMSILAFVIRFVNRAYGPDHRRIREEIQNSEASKQDQRGGKAV